MSDESNTLKAQTEAKVAAGRKGNPDFMKGVDETIAQAKAFQEGANALNLDQSAPRFELPNQHGEQVLLDELLAKGPVVITFYRGSWCPYYNLQLKALQSRLPEIHALGAQLVAISPQAPDGSMSENDIRNMDFVVLSDQNADVAASYGVAWQVPAFLLDHMREDRGLDLESLNNGNGSILPIPATFVLDSEGKVTWRYVDVDYRTRSEPQDIINALKALQ
ncbi:MULTISPECIES: peroxiredoxin-like family protein [unclassified Pseudoalteromonas]|uniref:peroxiredoxin-like family protein n=1 Tax=unclassified Pseudoalteromonas TaxID=194690 RepID=UPI000419CBDD|nr:MULTISPECIES: peroxiredoxin-like family protein [unclassified Pseudoalteromonas]MDC9496485.1 peroxiredoxin-like family protein [Pseudoalteromonas sp. Angola-20]MDC9516458.1 peroxiredoxin-like family protein [Pseudoalteromonas sp. Angola-22]MDC9532866.1 peroxiredoxin-like family protein [Pseudoalteromonas sp. Angola-9]TMP79017.1 thioredoxin-dependent thiol peroxidase [Pseudoalteromonas sp. S983]